MLNFDFCSPTRFIFGRGVEDNVGKLFRDMGVKCVMMQYGGGSIKKSGLYDRVVASLNAAGVKFIEKGGVKPNPRLSFVYEAVEEGIKAGVDAMLAVGGGSAIDSAKITAHGIANPGVDVWDYFMRKLDPPTKTLPLGVILTIPAAGSEGSDSAVITNEAEGLKRGLSCQANRPAFSLLNPELCFTLPKDQIAYGAVDMLGHIIERYISNTPDVALGDRLAEAVMKTIVESAPKLMDNPKDYEAWANLLWASTLAHNNSLGLGRQQCWASHQIEHELSAVYDVAHGAGLSVVYPSWMRYVYKANVARFTRFAVEVFGVDMDYFSPEKTALEGICRMEAFFRSLGAPTRLSELGIDEKNLRKMADNVKKTNGDGTVGGFVKLTAADCLSIYRNAL